MTKRLVILNAERERIRNTLKKKKRIATHLTVLAMTGDLERSAARLAAVSPAGSVGASASQRCPPDTRTAMTKYLYNTKKL